MPVIESPDDLIIEPLTRGHNVKAFDCGEPALNTHLQRHAKRNTLYGYGRTYVAVKPGEKIVLAYLTLVASEVDASLFSTSDGCPKFVSIVKLGRLGVDNSIKGLGVSYKLMGHAFAMSLEAAERIGVHAIVLDAKNEGLVTYYKKFGFMSLMDDAKHMYLPINQIRQAVSDEE